MKEIYYSMHISLLYLYVLILSGGSSAFATVNNENDISKMREEIEQLKNSEGKLKDGLIVSLQTAAISKDIHIKDLQTINTELQSTNDVLKKVLESVNYEIVNIRKLLNDTLEKRLSKIENQLENYNQTFGVNTPQITDKKFINCELKLNETQSLLQIQNKTIAEHLTKELISEKETIKEFQIKIKDTQDVLKKQNENLQQCEQEVTFLKEQIKQTEKEPNTCNICGDSNGIYNANIPDFDNFPVLCNSEIAGLAWTVIEQRINGEENFTRNWEDYKNGFGSFAGDFFLGLEKIYRLTNNQPHELYIHMEQYNGVTYFARYDNFSIAGEEDKYRLLSLGSYSGSEGDKDRMRQHEHQMFTTIDNDNDKWFKNCAEAFFGGWWYKNCFGCNLHGKYYQEENRLLESNFWIPYRSLKATHILIRPRYYY